jgi:hypothetical protein
METLNYVKQGKYKIINKNMGCLFTSGLATCSAISFIINHTDVFMAHIDAKTNVVHIANMIKSKYNSTIYYSDIKIWYGDGIYQSSSIVTQKLIANLVDLLGIDIKPIKERYEDIIEHLTQNIVECKLCGSKSGSLKIITHHFNCKYHFNISIRNAGFMETVYSF